MVTRLTAMQQTGADLPKLAAMPNSPSDVLELLAATAEMEEQHPETPVITMSMGALGAVSRLCGDVRLCHDLRQPRAGQRTRTGGAGCSE